MIQSQESHILSGNRRISKIWVVLFNLFYDGIKFWIYNNSRIILQICPENAAWKRWYSGNEIRQVRNSCIGMYVKTSFKSFVPNWWSQTNGHREENWEINSNSSLMNYSDTDFHLMQLVWLNLKFKMSRACNQNGRRKEFLQNFNWSVYWKDTSGKA